MAQGRVGGGRSEHHEGALVCDCDLRFPEADIAVNFGAERYHNDFLPWESRLTEYFDGGALASISSEELDALLARFSASHVRLGT
mmetsp:Transcript_91476/g.133747  ORF Transcript_91476/g.133747 Transcript_91476/m.133747 type:complete len:85 (+) Transcript_91476:2-256(+)